MDLVTGLGEGHRARQADHAGADDDDAHIRTLPASALSRAYAELSDNVRITLPTTPGHVDKPLLVRAGAVVVAPFQVH